MAKKTRNLKRDAYTSVVRSLLRMNTEIDEALKSCRDVTDDTYGLNLLLDRQISEATYALERARDSNRLAQGLVHHEIGIEE